MNEINIDEILKIYNDNTSSNTDISTDDDDKNIDEYYNNTNNNNINLLNQIDFSKVENNKIYDNKFNLNLFKNLDELILNYNDEINFILKVYNNFEIMNIEELEEIEDLPIWHKLIIINTEQLEEIKNNKELISSLKQYPFKSVLNNKIYYYNYKTKFIDNIEINENFIIFRKRFKLNKRQIFEILLRDLENGNLKINSK
jgi:hypothetical protein